MKLLIYYTTPSELTISTTTDGTSVSSTSSNSATGRYKGNTAITGDFELIADVKLNQAHSTVGLYIGVYSNDYTIFRIKSTDWFTVKIKREDGVFSVQTSNDGTTWTDGTFQQDKCTGSSVYPVLYVYNSSGSENGLSYKNLVLNNIFTGVTDGKGNFSLYNIDVTENTVFRALYQNEKAECEVKYCIKYYNGTISVNEYNEKMTSYSASTITVDYTGTLIETDASLISGTYIQLPFLNDTNYREVPLCYEMDIIDAPTNFALCFPVKMSDDTIAYWSSQSGKYGHIKVIITSEKAEYYLDGVRQWGTTSSQIPVSSRLYLQSTKSKGNGRIKIKNLAIYRI